MSEPVTIEQVDESALTRFKRKVAEFIEAGNYILGINEASVPPLLQPKYRSLRTQYNVVGKTVETIKKAIENTSDLFYDLFGKNEGLSSLETGYTNTLNALPLVGIAAVGGVIAAMTKFISDVYVFKSDLEETRRLEEIFVRDGLTQKDAAEKAYNITTEKNKSQALIGDLFGGIKPLLFIGGAFLLYKLFAKGN